VVLLAVLSLLFLGGWLLVQRKHRALAEAPRQGMAPTPVHVVDVRRGHLAESLTYLAACEPIQKSDMAARITASVLEVACDEGSIVKKNQVLVRLDDREIREGIAEVRADEERTDADLSGNEAIRASLVKSVAYWKREAARHRALANDGDIPSSEAEATEEKASDYGGRLQAAKEKSHSLTHQLQALAARKKKLEIQLSYCSIRSPYDGWIVRRLVDPGDLASPGKILLQIEDRSSLRLAFAVPQQDVARMRQGLDVKFRVGDQERKTRLTRLYPSLGVDRTVRVECVLAKADAQGLVSGSFVPVTVVLRESEGVVLVPQIAVMDSPAGKKGVFVVRGDKLALVAVTLLGREGQMVAVDGLDPGSRIVVSTFLGWARLASGMTVEPIR